MRQMEIINQMQQQFIQQYAPIVEMWLQVRGYPKYEVSSFGRVRNVTSKKILKPFKNNGYNMVNLCKKSKKKYFFIHRLVAKAFILNDADKTCVDHINHNKSDNNVINLRWATHSENNMNKRKQTSNTSGVIGVCRNKRDHKWQAYISIDGIRKHLGYFDTVEAAKRARVRAVNRLFGEFGFLE